jgi:hypothetical protein
MRNYLFIFNFSLVGFMLIVPSVSHAEWVEVGHSDERAFQMYYEPVSVKRNGDIATVKVLKNFRAPKNSVDPKKSYTFQSTISTQEIQCSSNKERLLHIDIWSGLSGAGKIEQSHDYREKYDWGESFKAISIENVVISKACQFKT